MVKSTIIVSAITGALSSLVFEPQMSFLRSLLLVVSGASAAVFTHPMVVFYLKVDERFSHGITFMLGLLSMKIVGILATVLDALRKDPNILLQYVRRFNNTNTDK